VHVSQLTPYHKACGSCHYFFYSVAANKEATEPRIHSGQVEAITWKSFYIATTTWLTIKKYMWHKMTTDVFRFSKSQSDPFLMYDLSLDL
jgi:hypothetical protein